MGLGDHPETFLLKALCCQRPPSWLKVMWWWVGGGGPGHYTVISWAGNRGTFYFPFSIFHFLFSIPGPGPVPVAWQKELRLWLIWIIDNYWIDCRVIMSTSLISPDKTQQIRASKRVAQCSCPDNITRTGKSFLFVFYILFPCSKDHHWNGST